MDQFFSFPLAITGSAIIWIVVLIIVAFSALWYLIPVLKGVRPKTNTTIDPPPGEIYVVCNNSILGFSRNNNGGFQTDPIRLISGVSTGLKNPIDVAIDGDGRIWVANLGQPVMNQPSITVYEANVTGDASPLHTFPINHPGGPALPGSLARHPQTGSFIVTLSNLNSLSGYRLPSDTVPVFHESGEGPNQPLGIAFNAGKMYVSSTVLPVLQGFYSPNNNAADRILIYETVAGGGFGIEPTASIGGDNTGLNKPAHIAFDNAGKLYVVNRGQATGNNPSITVYDAGQTGNISPLKTIAGTNTGLLTFNSIIGITIDDNGFIYVTNNNRVLVFEPQAHGNVSPFQTIEMGEYGSTWGIADR